jgi:hypothetical protein
MKALEGIVPLGDYNNLQSAMQPLTDQLKINGGLSLVDEKTVPLVV